MPENRIYYSQFGRKPAQLSAVVPGLGQLYNKQYLKAATAISIFTFACGLTLLLAVRATVGAWFTLPLLAVPPLTWGLSIYDAYQVGIERRRRDARRFKAEICTVVRGPTANRGNVNQAPTVARATRSNVKPQAKVKIETATAALRYCLFWSERERSRY